MLDACTFTPPPSDPCQILYEELHNVISFACSLTRIWTVWRGIKWEVGSQCSQADNPQVHVELETPKYHINGVSLMFSNSTGTQDHWLQLHLVNIIGYIYTQKTIIKLRFISTLLQHVINFRGEKSTDIILHVKICQKSGRWKRKASTVTFPVRDEKALTVFMIC